MHDCYFVDLFVRPTNTAAIKFYEGLGYVIYRALPFGVCNHHVTTCHNCVRIVGAICTGQVDTSRPYCLTSLPVLLHILNVNRLRNPKVLWLVTIPVTRTPLTCANPCVEILGDRIPKPVVKWTKSHGQKSMRNWYIILYYNIYIYT